ncbi:MAG TPA: hypothetical protein VFM69_01385 [Pricia sp.]|nr:hypothetical protein [Pricia sp.]
MKAIPGLLTLSLLCCSFHGGAQVKNEREYRIDSVEFPNKAIRLMTDYLDTARRIRYFKEYDGARIHYEIKLILNRKKYSVEFDSIGNLMDVETYIENGDIPSEARQNIETYLKSEYTRYRIVKVQRQYPKSSYRQDDTLLENAFKGVIDSTINYEMVIAGRKKKGFEDYEISFDGTGQIVSNRNFISIGYDHILY